MTDTTHQCPAPACERRLPFRIFACPAHWRMLPFALRRDLTAAWNRTGAGTDYGAARLACVEWLRDNLDGPGHPRQETP